MLSSEPTRKHRPLQREPGVSISAGRYIFRNVERTRQVFGGSSTSNGAYPVRTLAVRKQPESSQIILN